MRTFFASLFSLFSLIAPALAQGVVPGVLSSNVDQNGRPLAGALLYVYVNATTTPQTCYSDLGLTQPMTWPIVADNAGRIPLFYCAAGQVHLRLTDAHGNQVYDYPTALVVGPAGGGGGGGGTGVDPTTVASTGDIKFRQSQEVLTGWIKLNGTTIGSASSGASQRANADTQNLYIYLWTQCSFCAVAGGKGSTGLSDFQANKPLTVPDWRARAAVGLDDMGTTPAGFFSGVPFNFGNATTAGSAGGSNGVALSQGNLPSIRPTGTVTSSASSTVSGGWTPSGSVTISGSQSSGGAVGVNPANYTPAGTVSVSGGTVTANGSVAMSGTAALTGSITGSQTLSQVVNSSTGTSQSINVTGSSYRVADLTVNGSSFTVSGTIPGSALTATWTPTATSVTGATGGFIGTAADIGSIINGSIVFIPGTVSGSSFSGSLTGGTPISASSVIAVGTTVVSSFTGDVLGSSLPFSTMQAFVVGTWYVKQ